MALRDSMRDSVVPYLRPGEPVPRATRLGPGTGLWHRIPAGHETLRVHRRFFADIYAADAAMAAA
jgi:hypothetical protein